MPQYWTLLVVGVNGLNCCTSPALKRVALILIGLW